MILFNGSIVSSLISFDNQNETKFKLSIRSIHRRRTSEDACGMRIWMNAHIYAKRVAKYYRGGNILGDRHRNGRMTSRVILLSLGELLK